MPIFVISKTNNYKTSAADETSIVETNFSLSGAEGK